MFLFVCDVLMMEVDEFLNRNNVRLEEIGVVGGMKNWGWGGRVSFDVRSGG